MATIDFRHLVLITLFAAALTSSVNAEPDGASSIPSSDPSLKSLSPTVEHSPDVVDDKKVSKLFQTSRLTEGGPIPISTTTQNANNESIADALNMADESRARENVLKEKNDNSSVTANKIKARKGVDQGQNTGPQANKSVNQTSFEDIEPGMETAQAVHVNNQSETSMHTSKLNVTNSQVNHSLDPGTNSSYSSTTSTPTNITTVYTITNYTTTSKASHTEKHIPKPKPTVTTVDGPDPSESRLSLRKKDSPLGMPRKIDYIIPVIITIIALPILGTAIFVLYRRGRDCWDKRHYRRMDFLIDGMYND